MDDQQSCHGPISAHEPTRCTFVVDDGTRPRKRFLDQLYYLGLDVTKGRPYGLWVHGQNDTTGAVWSVTKVADALGWRQVAEPVTVVGEPTAQDREALAELAATVAVSL